MMSNDRVLEEDHGPLHVLEYLLGPLHVLEYLLMSNDGVWRRITFHCMYWNIY